MTELKTLKDLGVLAQYTDGKMYKQYTEWELKQEAIKWVKKFDEIEKDEDPDYKIKYSDVTISGFKFWFDPYENDTIMLQDFLKFFFNLTEEDLQ